MTQFITVHAVKSQFLRLLLWIRRINHWRIDFGRQLLLDWAIMVTSGSGFGKILKKVLLWVTRYFLRRPVSQPFLFCVLRLDGKLGDAVVS
ncbi:MAG: hypothetical protein NZ480_05015, partial [Bdellovibrionaceae bacterium]|nr:hypothetical protein [Pseudobdellovibrionaceae bacterium]